MIKLYGNIIYSSIEGINTKMMVLSNVAPLLFLNLPNLDTASFIFGIGITFSLQNFVASGNSGSNHCSSNSSNVYSHQYLKTWSEQHFLSFICKIRESSLVMRKICNIIFMMNTKLKDSVISTKPPALYGLCTFWCKKCRTSITSSHIDSIRSNVL